MSTDLTALTRAASSALLDMRLDAERWEAVETDHRTPGRIIVTLRRDAEPLTCVCPDPNSDQIEEDCHLCLYGEPDSEYAEVEFTLTVAAR